MNPWNSAIYAGKVTHKRMRPKQHFLLYSMFYMLLDIDEIDMIAKHHWLFSRNRRNLFSFFDRDHGNKSGTCDQILPLRDYVENRLREAEIKHSGCRICLMTMPRIFGYVFNPLSVYFCHDDEDRLFALIYEVNNTFGQRHSYIFPLEGDARKDNVFRQECDKEFYVSPFLDMNLVYDFTITRPAGSASIVINARDKNGLLIATAFRGKRREFGDRQLLRLALIYPLLTVKVIAGIHWEALQIWLKGIGLRPRPKTPRQTTTVGLKSSRKISRE